MRVLHLVTATHQRGAETVARNLVDELEERGVEGRLVALVPGQDESGSIKVDAVLSTDPATHLRWIPGAIAGLRTELRDHPADLILAHGAHAAFVAAALPGSPPIVWHRILESPDRGSMDPFHLAKRLLAKRIVGAVAITHRIAAEMRDLGFHGPVWYVPNHRPVPPPADNVGLARAEIRRELGFEPDSRIVSLIGHLVPQKDPCTAIEVFAEIAASDPSVQFVVAGDGPERPRAEALASERLGPDRVRFLGHRSDVSALFAATDVLVLTSMSDSMPGIAIEAQLAGCPVVSFPVDGVDEIVDHGVSGLITADRSPTAAAEASCRVLADPDLQASMQAAARTRAASFTTPAVAPVYEAIFELTARTPPAGDRVRVMHVMPNLGVGGAEQSLSVLADSVPIEQMSQIVTAVGGTRLPIEETVHSSLQRAGVGYCDLAINRAPTRSPMALLSATRRLRRVVRRTNVDVVDSALLDAALPSRLGSSRALRFTHLVNTTYDDVVGRASGARRWRRAAVRLVDAITARRDDRLIALTGAVAASSARALRLGHDDRLTVIPRGVDTERFADSRSEREPGRVVTVGRLVPQKGHDTLVRAVGEARDRGVFVRLDIVGEGPLQTEIERLVRELKIEDRVHLLGAQSDVRPSIAAAAVFALASRWEGQSNAVLEAMAMGSAVVASDIPTFKEVVADAGVLVPADDPTAWCDALLGVLADAPAARALGDKARRRAVEHFDAADRSQDLVEEYRAALRGRGDR